MPHQLILLLNEDMFGAMNNNLLTQLFRTLSQREAFSTQGIKTGARPLPAPKSLPCGACGVTWVRLGRSWGDASEQHCTVMNQ